MASKRIEQQERKDRILGITIGHYIKTVTPVSSAVIAKKDPADLSSATIRNILAELEDEGYLTHPHTSAGRVPTQQGYRYYVDHLMDEIELLGAEKKRIKSELEQEREELDLLLEKTSQVISEVTHYTSIISIDGLENRVYCQGTNYVVNYPDYQDINKIGEILTALDQKEKLLNIINQNLEDRINIYIGQEMKCSEIQSCSLVVSKYNTKKGVSGRISVLGPTRMDYGRVISALDYLSDLINEVQ